MSISFGISNAAAWRSLKPIGTRYAYTLTFSAKGMKLAWVFFKACRQKVLYTQLSGSLIYCQNGHHQKKKFLTWMCGKEQYYPLFVGAYFRIATLENSLEFSQKTRSRTTIYTILFSHFFLDVFLIAAYNSPCTPMPIYIDWGKEISELASFFRDL